MISFQCPSCGVKCSLDEKFRGRKMRCPKCKTRVRHHEDGTIELLTIGKATSKLGPPPLPPPSAAPKPSPPPLDLDADPLSKKKADEVKLDARTEPVPLDKIESPPPPKAPAEKPVLRRSSEKEPAAEKPVLRRSSEKEPAAKAPVKEPAAKAAPPSTQDDDETQPIPTD